MGSSSPATTANANPHAHAATSKQHRQLRNNATTCALCGKDARDNDPWVADHFIPRARGGPDTIDNLQPAHRSCNGRRGQAMQQ
jgi:5-methylcytosine-specific restriction endonuclease McrA